MKTHLNISITLAMALGMTGSALADAHKEKAPAAGAPAAKAPDAAKKIAPPKMEAPKPPAEIATAAKTMVGTWKCTGKAMMNPADPTQLSDMKSTMTFKLDAATDKFWIVGTMTSQSKPTMKGSMFQTYDASAKKWYRIGIDNMGGSDTASSTGPKDGKTLWEGEMRMPGMGNMKTRTTETMAASNKEITIVAEGTMDGKTWLKGWEATCKK